MKCSRLLIAAVSISVVFALATDDVVAKGKGGRSGGGRGGRASSGRSVGRTSRGSGSVRTSRPRSSGRIATNQPRTSWNQTRNRPPTQASNQRLRAQNRQQAKVAPPLRRRPPNRVVKNNVKQAVNRHGAKNVVKKIATKHPAAAKKVAKEVHRRAHPNGQQHGRRYAKHFAAHSFHNAARHAFRYCPTRHVLRHGFANWWLRYACGVHHFHGRRLVVNSAFWSGWRPCSYRYVRCGGRRCFVGLRCVAIPGVAGVGVASIEPGSPAELAGLQQGDLVMSINGQTPATDDVLSSSFDTSTLSMEILRDGASEPTLVSVTPTQVGDGLLTRAQ